LRIISDSSTLPSYVSMPIIDSLLKGSTKETPLTIEGLTMLAYSNYAGRTIEVPLRAELKDDYDDGVDPSLTLLIAHA